MPVNYKNPVLNLIVGILMVILFFIHPVYFVTGIGVYAIIGIIWKSPNLSAWAVTILIFLGILAILLLPNAA